ncbi:polysialyltransferase family glycosyltransferase [Arthrobacter sp. NPDC089319]|uniref:polysialyltransferase family glycosyltransferase n=1 Tax=Arthrobacter sp. NPDC089319 TaxID=3155915 RepID=UPI0034334B48
MKQLIAASTLYQCISLAAMIDDGSLPPADERILVLAGSAHQPELSVRIQDTPGFERIATRFDRIVDLGALLWPRRPGQFKPREEELALWETLLRSHWELGSGPLQLVVESIQVDPAIALCRIFGDATVWVHSDGLMSYGPTRNATSLSVAQRLDGIIYVDLVPGLHPQLLAEHQPTMVAVERPRLKAVIEDVAAVNSIPEEFGVSQGSTALILGQYLADLGILTVEEEDLLHRKMLMQAASRGIRHCIFKPHPSAGPAATKHMQQTAKRLGIAISVLESPVLAEVVMEKIRPDLVVSCFSTALITARFVYGIETMAVGTEMLLERLTPYQNSNRIPVTIVDAILVRGLEPPGDEARMQPIEQSLQALVEAVSYCMQPRTLASARASTIEFLEGTGSDSLRYFKRLRLAKLDLPVSEYPKESPSLRSLRVSGRGAVKRWLRPLRSQSERRGA